MQHFASFNSSTDETEKKDGGWARDAAIGGLEAGLGFAATDKIHHAIANNPKLASGFLGSKAGKVTLGVGTGAVGTLAVGAGLNAASGLLKKKPKPQEDQYNTQQPQAQYSNPCNHFADFVSPNSLGTQTQAGKDAQWLMKNDREGYEEYKRQGRAQADKLRANPSLNAANEGLPTNQINKNINKTVVNNLATKSPVANVKGFLGKAKNTVGRYGKAAAGLGGAALTASYILPTLGGLIPQKPQPEQEPPY